MLRHACCTAIAIGAGLALLGAAPAAIEPMTPPEDAAAPAAPQGRAAVTLVGRKGQPAAIVDDATGEAVEVGAAARYLNVATPTGIAGSAARAEATANAIAAKQEAGEKDRIAAEKAAGEQAKTDAKRKEADAKAAAEQARLDAANAAMWGKGWQPWSSDGKTLFNPNLMQYRPRTDLVKEHLPAEDAPLPAPPPPPAPSRTKLAPRAFGEDDAF